MLDVLLFPDNLDRADYAILALHGRSASKSAFLPFVRQIDFPHTRWVLPSAPHASDDGKHARRWYEHETENLSEMAESREALGELIEWQAGEGIATENIFLIGFSQGAVMAIDTALRFPRRLGGIAALSGYVPHPELLAAERNPSNHRLPIFLAHGTRDRTLPIGLGRDSHRILVAMGCQVTYVEYDTGHRISSQETRDIRSFLHRHMYGLEYDDPRKLDEHIAPF